MLEDFKESQKDLCEVLNHSIAENRMISHAYLLETNGFSRGKELAIAIAKTILCTCHQNDTSNGENCHICDLVDQQIYADFCLIEPDGQWIKKEQLMQLQEKFKTKSLENGYRVYIIMEADKLNPASANSILKFLEEPEENIVAILVAQNRYQVLETILSRCQILRCNNIEDQSTDLSENEPILESVIQFVSLIESKGTKTIAYLNDFWTSTIKTKEDFLKALQFVQQYYECIIDIYLHRTLGYPYFVRFVEEMNQVAEKNTLHELARKIHIISTIFEKVRYNANQSLQLDKLIIDLCGGAQ